MGRLSTYLPMGVRLLMIKADGSFQVHSDGGGSKVKPQNWMTPPTAIDVEGDPPARIEVRKLKGGERLEITIDEVLSDLTHEADLDSVLEKDGVMDTFTIVAETRDHLPASQGERLIELIAAEVIRQCELRPRIRLVTPGTLPKTEFKARRVIDRREVL